MLATSSPLVIETASQKSRARIRFGDLSVLLCAGIALMAKLLIALNTIGTNDVPAFYRFGRSLSERGLEWTYVSDVAFNHPPLMAGYLRIIYQLDHLSWLSTYGLSFPFLLRLPGIVADSVVVMVLLKGAKQLRLPFWGLILLALSPVSLMISGFHGNTDSIMVMFIVLAAWLSLKEKPTLSGLVLALSCQIKIIPLLLAPIFFFYWMERRRTLSLTLPFFLTMVLCWIDPLLRFPEAFIHRVLFYGSFWGLWGVTYWLKLTGIRDFAPVTFYNFLPLQQLAITVLKMLIVTAVLFLAWRRRKLNGRALFVSLGWAWVIFFILSPGICAQYMVWLMPFVLVISPGFFAWLTVTSSLFLFFFYNTIAHGFPWYYAVSAGRQNDLWLPWSLWPWAVLILGGVILWKQAVRAEPTLRMISLATIKSDPKA